MAYTEPESQTRRPPSPRITLSSREGSVFQHSRKGMALKINAVSALLKQRWPLGFVRSHRALTSYCEVTGRAMFQCHQCYHQTSLISGNISEYTKLPLTIWFLGMYYTLTQPKNRGSALEPKQQSCASLPGGVLPPVSPAPQIRGHDHACRLRCCAHSAHAERCLQRPALACPVQPNL